MNAHSPAAHHSPGRIGLWLGVILVLALTLRVLNLIDISDSPFFTRPVIDGQAYDRWAVSIVEGKTPAEPFYQDPLYPYFLALVYSVFGHSYGAVYVIQLALAMVLLLLVYDTTRCLFDRRAAVAAAAIAALYKPFIFYESQIEKTSLAVFLTALFLWLFVRSTNSRTPAAKSRTEVGRWLWPLGSGVALGLAALTRANILLFAPLLPLALWIGPRTATRRSRTTAAAASMIGVLLVIAPVSIRNSLLTHEFTLTTTQGGQNLYSGNSQYNTTGLCEPPPWVRPNPDFLEADFAGYARKATGRALSPGQVSRFYTSAALDWAKAHPRDLLELLWRKTVLYFNDFEVSDNQDISFFSRYSWVLRLPLLSFGIVFGLGFAAMILLGRGLSRLSLVIFFFGYAASVVTFFMSARYRLPSLPALLPFAGAMPLWFLDPVRRRERSRAGHGRARTNRRRSFPWRPAGGLALVLAALAPTLYPVRTSLGGFTAAVSLTNLAINICAEGDTARAIATYEEALAAEPGLALASLNLGAIMLERNEYERALRLLSDAVRTSPSDPTNHLMLGRLYQRRGQPEAARVEFRKAIALAPARVELRFELATALLKVDSYPQALAHYDTLTQLDPDNPVVRHNLAVCLYKLDRLDEARTQLEAARRLGSPINPTFDSLLRTGRDPTR